MSSEPTKEAAPSTSGDAPKKDTKAVLNGLMNRIKAKRAQQSKENEEKYGAIEEKTGNKAVKPKDEVVGVGIVEYFNTLIESVDGEPINNVNAISALTGPIVEDLIEVFEDALEDLEEE